MTSEDLTVMTFMATVPALTVLLFALAVIAVSRMTAATSRRSFVVAAGVFSFLMFCGVASVFWFWGVGFDYADTGRRTPAYVDRVMVISFWLAAGAYVGVLASGLTAHLALRRHRAEVPPGVQLAPRDR